MRKKPGACEIRKLFKGRWEVVEHLCGCKIFRSLTTGATTRRVCSHHSPVRGKKPLPEGPPVRTRIFNTFFDISPEEFR